MIDVGVYIIQRGEGGPVKIGRSASSITRRIQTIQQCTPESLIELARIVDVRIESSLHEKFRRSRIRGEWFHPTPDIIAYAEEANRAGGIMPFRWYWRPNHGALALDEVMRTRNLTLSQVQTEVCAMGDIVRGWWRASGKPHPENRKALLKLYGIPIDAWDISVELSERAA